MKKRIFTLMLAVGLLLTACGQQVPEEPKEPARLTIVATTYPIYLFANSVAGGVDGVEVLRLDTGSTSCLHDYNLTVNDMKKLEKADVIAINGAGLEEFMEDAMSTTGALIIDCSEGVELLENLSHHHDEEDHSHDGHDHGHYDPHIWMDPENARIMIRNITDALVGVDAEHAERYNENYDSAHVLLGTLDHNLELIAQNYSVAGLITFHDGFQYFAHAYGLPQLESIEEEAGSEASAKEITEITALVREHDVPAIFTEVNGSDATAIAIARETGCAVAQLSMCMDGAGYDVQDYFNIQMENMAVIVNNFAGEEVVVLG